MLTRRTIKKVERLYSQLGYDLTKPLTPQVHIRRNPNYTKPTESTQNRQKPSDLEQ